VYRKYLNAESLIFLLLRIDKELAEKVRERRCSECGGPLHVANYPRKPRGKPFHDTDTYWLRYSFCCGHCRHRMTPPSVRFLGRRVYLGLIVFLVTACRQDVLPQQMKELKKTLGVSRRTLLRWKRWWNEFFPKSDFWQQAKRQLFPRLDTALSVPESLKKLFDVGSSLDNLIKLLRFIAPITTKFRVSEHASLWPS